MPKADLPTNNDLIMAKYTRYNELYMKANKTTAENAELASLQMDLADYLITATDWNSLFTSVSDGKNKIATAITGKGIAASGSDTYTQLSNKISSIQTGSETSDGTANADDILAPKVAYSKNQRIVGTLSLSGNAADSQVLFGQTYYNSDAKTKRSGTMPNRGALSFTPSDTPQFIPEGYYNGSGTIAAGKRKYSGIAILDTAQGTRGFERSDGQVLYMGMVVATGLPFKPRVIILYTSAGNYVGAVYSDYSNTDPSTGFKYVVSLAHAQGTSYRVGTTNCWISNTGFSMPFYYQNANFDIFE
nr:hypothetical protein [Mycobacterium sp. E3298]